MKKILNVFALILAVLMVVTLAAPAYADDSVETYSDKYTITIKEDTKNRTYKAYQIFTGDISNTEMTEVEWGTGVTAEGQSKLLEKYCSGVENADAQDVAKCIVDESDAKALANTLVNNNYLDKDNGKEFTYDEANANYVLGNLVAGYYLIVEETEVDGKTNMAASAYMMRLVKSVEITPKAGQPTIKKKVSDINDSEEKEMTNHLDTADHDIGDSVPFHLHIVLGKEIDEYTSYKLVITDTLSKGLTYEDGTLVVEYGDTVVASGYTVTVTPQADGSTKLVITFEDLYDMEDVDENALVPQDDGIITIDYTATLNENAVIGAAGNPNQVYMEYSNNPYSDSMGKTETDTVIVFTYKVIVNKVNEELKPLTGATFALYKNTSKGDWVLVKNYVGVTDESTFEFTGLDDGYYKLVEVDAPDGYNKIEDQYFKVVATHTNDNDSNPLQLTSLTGNKEIGTIELSHNLAAGTLSTDIVNEKGATLPSTGGIGTTIFYTLGGLMVCGAIVLLVTKKRMSAEA